MTLDFKGLSK